MTKQETTISNVIEQLFTALSSDAKVSLMTTLYYSMLDGQKDEFLRETENA